MTQIQTMKATDPEAFDAAVNTALQEGERWARMREIQTYDHDGWLVAILVYSAPDEPASA